MGIDTMGFAYVWINLQMYRSGDDICRRMHNKSHMPKKHYSKNKKSNAWGNADKNKVVEKEKAIKISKQMNSENNNSSR